MANEVKKNTPNKQYKVQISSNGRLNIPSELRKYAKLKDGDELILTLQNNAIYLQRLDQIIEEAQSLVAHYFPKDNLIDELRIMREHDAKCETRFHKKE